MDELLAGYENAINSYDIEIIDFNLATEENTIIDAYTIL